MSANSGRLENYMMGCEFSKPATLLNLCLQVICENMAPAHRDAHSQ